MSNKCENLIRLMCSDAKTAQRLAKDMNDALDNAHSKDNYSDIETLAKLYSIDTDELYTRSRITEIYNCGNEVTISSISDWSPSVGIYREICNKNDCIKKVYFKCEEEGLDIFVTNDPSEENTYYLRTDCDVEYVDNEDEVIDKIISYIQEQLYMKTTRLDDLLEIANDILDLGIVVSRFEREDIDCFKI